MLLGWQELKVIVLTLLTYIKQEWKRLGVCGGGLVISKGLDKARLLE